MYILFSDLKYFLQRTKTTKNPDLKAEVINCFAIELFIQQFRAACKDHFI